jgi:hypothetical protein
LRRLAVRLAVVRFVFGRRAVFALRLFFAIFAMCFSLSFSLRLLCLPNLESLLLGRKQ